jgi:type II secretory pathway pseudopilin PulG
MRRPVSLTTLRELVLPRADRRPRDEDGFILLESIVALSMVTVLLAALASFTLNAVTSTTELRARQGAVQVATSTMAMISSLPADDLVAGRGRDSATAQLNTARSNGPDSVRAAISTAAMAPAYLDPPAVALGAGATAAIPTVPLTPQKINSVTYDISIYLGRCQLRSATSTDCVNAVLWSGRGCNGGGCTYVTSTLVNPDTDPVFNINRNDAPSDPVVADPGAQVASLGAQQSLQLAVQADTGLGPFTWQVTGGALPAGLSLSGTGLISGSPTVVGGPTSVTVTVTDAFGRTAAGSFTWKVVAAPTVTAPPAQTSPRGRALSLVVASTCPNGPCTFTAAGLPAGLGIDAANGTISGTPTTVGTSSVTVTATSVDGAPGSSSAFTWTVTQPVTVGSPGPLAATVGSTVSIPVAYTCSSGPCVITLAGTASGIGLSTAPNGTAANGTASLSVANGSGTVYLTGTVQAAAVPAGSTSRAYAPTLSIAASGVSATSAPGAWTIFVKPTLGPVGNRNATVGASKTVGVDYTCPNTPCALSLTSTVPGIGISATAEPSSGGTAPVTVTAPTGTVYLTGVVADNAVPTGTTRAYPVSISIADASSVTATSSGTWTATTAPRIINPGTQAVQPNNNVSLQLASDCPNGGCTFAADVQVGNSWAPVPISTTGRLSYANVPAGTYVVRTRITDADGIVDEEVFTIISQTFSLSMPPLATNRPIGFATAVFDTTSVLVPQSAGSSGFTYSLSGAPTWLSINPSTGLMTANINTLSGSDTSITVTATSIASSTSSVSSTFAWRIQ